MRTILNEKPLNAAYPINAMTNKPIESQSAFLSEYRLLTLLTSNNLKFHRYPIIINTNDSNVPHIK